MSSCFNLINKSYRFLDSWSFGQYAFFKKIIRDDTNILKCWISSCGGKLGLYELLLRSNLKEYGNPGFLVYNF